MRTAIERMSEAVTRLALVEERQAARGWSVFELPHLRSNHGKPYLLERCSCWH